MEQMVYFSINASDLHSIWNEEPDEFENLHLNIILQDAAQITPGFIKQLSQTNTFFIFSLSASFVNAIDGELLSMLYAVISLGNNFRYNEKNVITIRSASIQMENVQSTLECFFEEQGLKLIIAFLPEFENKLITEHNGIINLPENIFENENLQCELLRKLISEEDHSFLSITAMNPVLFKNFQKQEQGSGKWLPIIGKILQLKFDMNRLMNSEQNFKKRSLLYYEFLTLSKKVQEKEYYDLYNWYHKEYEVLPLWYKRLGHIIKVFSGKRTFKSLFSDKIKKMKS